MILNRQRQSLIPRTPDGRGSSKWLKETAELCDGISPCHSVREGSPGAGLLTMLIFSAVSRCVDGEPDRSYRHWRRALCLKGGGDVRSLSRADGLLNMLVQRYSRCTCKYACNDTTIHQKQCSAPTWKFTMLKCILPVVNQCIVCSFSEQIN